MENKRETSFDSSCFVMIFRWNIVNADVSSQDY